MADDQRGTTSERIDPRDRRVEDADTQRRARHRPDRRGIPCGEPAARLPVDGKL